MTTSTGDNATYNLQRFDLELPLDTLRRNLGPDHADVHRMTTELIDYLDTFLDATFTAGIHTLTIHAFGNALDDNLFTIGALGHIDGHVIAVYAYVNPDTSNPRLTWDIEEGDTTADEATITRVRRCLYDAVRTAALLDETAALA